MYLSEHFTTDEFACRCCGRCIDINPRLIDLLEILRADAGGYPIYIYSGYRCPKHNSEVGGVLHSQHMLGNAADISIPDAMDLREFLWYCQQLPFDWIGVYPRDYFIHVDVRAGGLGFTVTDWMQ